MKIVGHGHWVRYVPAPEDRPKHAPPHALFCRRESDLVDWYKYRETMNPTTVKCSAARQGDHFIIGPATRDVTMLFPSEQFVFEIVGYAGDNPFDEFNNRIFDVDALKVGGMRPKLPNLFHMIEDVAKRVAVLETEMTEIKKRRKTDG